MSAAPLQSDPAEPTAHFLSLLTWTRDDLETILARAADILDAADRRSPLEGRCVCLCWSTPADRNRADFAAALHRAGCREGQGKDAPAVPEGLPPAEADVAVYRSVEVSPMLQSAGASRIPIVNGGTAHSEPHRVLGEIFSLRRAGVDPDGARIAWLGEPGPRLHSWLEAAVRFAFHLEVRLPLGVTDPALTAYAIARARAGVRFLGSSGGLSGVDVVLADEADLYHSIAGTGKVTAIGVQSPWSWGAEADAAVALGVLEEVWVRTRRARERSGGSAVSDV